MPDGNRDVAALNGDIVSESKHKDPDLYLEAYVDNQKYRTLLNQKITYIQQKARRDRAKAFSERNFLARKRSKKVVGIVKKFPDIGKEIECFVEERSVGADSWRRTGVYTFDGNKPIGQKVTYQRIREHLQSVYKCKISYGMLYNCVWHAIVGGDQQNDTKGSLR